MQATATSPSRSNLFLWVLAVLGVGLLSILLVSLLSQSSKPSPASGQLAPSGPQVAYFSFGSAADTLWLADPQQPGQRRSILSLPHATDFGVVPSLSRDGRRFVFASLPPTTKAPSPETPADLWLSDVSGAEPKLVARGVDLLVPATWSRDGESVVFRRSRLATQATISESRLFAIDLETGVERELASASDAALFPVGFAPDGSFYFVRLDREGSHVAAVSAPGDQTYVMQLATGLTRDWTLSPNADRLAFLAIDLTETTASSTALMLNLSSGKIEPASATADNAFGPVWTAGGELVVGTLGNGEAGAGITSLAAGVNLPRPARGFDVPMAFTSAGDQVLVRSFEGNSVMAPGRSTLSVLGPDGTRTTIASGEVTFLGWINP